MKSFTATPNLTEKEKKKKNLPQAKKKSFFFRLLPSDIDSK
jgi:hypothetical protein